MLIDMVTVSLSDQIPTNYIQATESQVTELQLGIKRLILSPIIKCEAYSIFSYLNIVIHVSVNEIVPKNLVSNSIFDFC